MDWNVVVGQGAPGLGLVIATKQMCPDYHESIRYSGKNGYLVLIAIENDTPGSNKFTLAEWLYGETECGWIESSYISLASAWRDWERICDQM